MTTKKEKWRVTLPSFSHIQVAEIEKKLDQLLQKNKHNIDALLDKITQFTWPNLMDPIHEWQDALHQFWGPIQHLSAVMDSPELREVMHCCLPKLSDYQTYLSHHQKLFQAITALKNDKAFDTLSIAQKKAIENELRDFKLNGVNLPEDKKKEFSELSKALSRDSHRFEENVLDATMSFKKHFADDAALSGIPEIAKNSAKNAAKRAGMTGYLFSLEAPDYLAIMMHADDRALRELFYTAFVTRASTLGPDAGKFDNSPIMQSLLNNRKKLAHLLGFEDFASYSLATKMVKKPEVVLDFLYELSEKTKLHAQTEWKALCAFSEEHLSIKKLAAWDVAYASEKLRQKNYSISQEQLRPYFPITEVLSGLFSIIQRLYDVTATVTQLDTWHPDVLCYQLHDKNNALIAHLYFDLYARPNKRGGAWMDDCMIRRRQLQGDIQLPAAYINCNFSGPTDNKPALLTHDDVVTLFHECGHALQHVLTKIDVDSVSGIRGIPWDAVEIASQFFENWAWEEESVLCFAKHFETKAPLPEDLFSRMHQAKNFQSALHMLRQLEFALFDFRLHREFDANDPDCVQRILNEVRQKISVYLPPDFNRFQHSFTHIFGGGYAAGYYSYKWAEMMACDAFSRFEETDIFNHTASTDFKKTFLESGGAIEPMDLFITFRGRPPSVDALLKQTGISR